MKEFDSIIDSPQVSTAKGAMIGLALGEALRTGAYLPVIERPSTDVSSSLYTEKRGLWRDLSLAVALSDSLLANGRLDSNDLKCRYSNWRKENAAISTVEHFQIGNNLNRSLNRYESWKEESLPIYQTFPDEDACLARIAPICVFFSPYKGESLANIMQTIKISCEVTHQSHQAVIASQMVAGLLYQRLRLSTQSKAEFLASLHSRNIVQNIEVPCTIAEEIIRGDYQNKHRHELTSETALGSLEAALWCFYHSDNFAKGALLAANSDNELSSTSTIYGQIAGAFYGASELPQEWCRAMTDIVEINRLSDLLIWTPPSAQLVDIVARSERFISKGESPIVPELYFDIYRHQLLSKCSGIIENNVLLEGGVDEYVCRINEFSYTQAIQFIAAVVHRDLHKAGFLEFMDKRGVLAHWHLHISKFVNT
ncbi:ADP-ribosylglycohydrolase family protein [Vibrio sp. ZSDE26]|uniref:ADP-ribosylglycohydrolase family protein n=1 Tax=Vibrio amylolyticus TaxID=2847292 RepID=A0A9X1XQ05_9VIBR|nr:ADP-ribosylglycohydrolase family protein [Vibrio amylolyticus]MCK6263439.1 ADP-ribosylglycohydrolase family protein [Vibrio amylolyticus]